LVYSQLWLNLFFDDHHFGYITILAKKKKMDVEARFPFIVPNAQTSSLYNKRMNKKREGAMAWY
jgi:hypothetical protein